MHVGSLYYYYAVEPVLNELDGFIADSHSGVALFHGQTALQRDWVLIQSGATENGAVQLLYRRRPPR
jgi:hypothetical protein